MFRFTIRDVLWLTVVVALALGWWVDHRRTGQAPAQLLTLINILESRDINVSLESNGVRAEGIPTKKYWKHYQALGTEVLPTGDP